MTARLGVDLLASIVPLTSSPLVMNAPHLPPPRSRHPHLSRARRTLWSTLRSLDFPHRPLIQPIALPRPQRSLCSRCPYSHENLLGHASSYCRVQESAEHGVVATFGRVLKQWAPRVQPGLACWASTISWEPSFTAGRPGRDTRTKDVSRGYTPIDRITGPPTCSGQILPAATVSG